MKYVISTLCILIGIFFLWMVAAGYIPVMENGWHLFTGRGYQIPAGSSVFSFRPAVMNPGSGEWWLYGEDNTYYYYLDGKTKISKKHAKGCRGFRADDHTTWCKTMRR